MKWTPTLLNYIRVSANDMTDKILTKKLEDICGQTIHVQSVRKQRQKMGIFKECGRGKCKVSDKHTLKGKATVVTTSEQEKLPENT